MELLKRAHQVNDNLSCMRRCAKELIVDTLYAKDIYQALVYPTDERTGRTGRGNSANTKESDFRTNCLKKAKKDGFSDKYLAQTFRISRKKISGSSD